MFSNWFKSKKNKDKDNDSITSDTTDTSEWVQKKRKYQWRVGYRIYTDCCGYNVDGKFFKYNPFLKQIYFSSFSHCSCRGTSDTNGSDGHSCHNQCDLEDDDSAHICSETGCHWGRCRTNGIMSYTEVINRFENNYSMSCIISNRVVDPDDTDYDEYMAYKKVILEWKENEFDKHLWKKKLFLYK